MNFEHGPSEQDIIWKAEQPPQLKKVEQQFTSGGKQYETREGEKVTLQWELINPKDETVPEGKALIFLPGVALDADSKSVVNTAEDAAEASGLPTYSITTRVENAKAENSQSLQAEAVQQFIAERNLKQITLSGNSQGANKAGFLYHELKQNSPNLQIQGIVLDSPAGLYDQNSLQLTVDFYKDSLLKTGPDVIKNSKIGSAEKIKNTFNRMGRAVRLGADVGAGMTKEFSRSPTEFPDRVLREGKEAGTENPYWNEVDCPVVIIIGDKDEAFKTEKILPESPFNTNVIFKESIRDKTVKAQNLREEILKKVFPNSPMVRVLIGSKDSTHAMRFTRGKKVPSSGWHMLQRMEREINASEQT